MKSRWKSWTIREHFVGLWDGRCCASVVGCAKILTWPIDRGRLEIIGNVRAEGADHGWREPIWVDSRGSDGLLRDYEVPGVVVPLWQIWLDQSIGDVLKYMETTLERPNQVERPVDHALTMCNVYWFVPRSSEPERTITPVSHHNGFTLPGHINSLSLPSASIKSKFDPQRGPT